MDHELKINELEIEVAKLQAHHINLHKDISELTAEVKKLRQELTQGKGIAIGMIMVLGAAWTFITKVFMK